MPSTFCRIIFLNKKHVEIKFFIWIGIFEQKLLFQFQWCCCSRRTSCLRSSLGDILQSRSRASICKIFAFAFFGCFQQVFPLLLCGYFGHWYLCFSALVVCVSSYWFFCTPNLGRFKQLFIKGLIVSFSIRLIWLCFTSEITSFHSVSFYFGYTTSISTKRLSSVRSCCGYLGSLFAFLGSFSSMGAFLLLKFLSRL